MKFYIKNIMTNFMCIILLFVFLFALPACNKQEETIRNDHYFINSKTTIENMDQVEKVKFDKSCIYYVQHEHEGDVCKFIIYARDFEGNELKKTEVLNDYHLDIKSFDFDDENVYYLFDNKVVIRNLDNDNNKIKTREFSISKGSYAGIKNVQNTLFLINQYKADIYKGSTKISSFVPLVYDLEL